MNPVFLGNAISLVGALMMIAIGLIKRKNNILIAQCAQFGVMGIGQFILGGMTGVVSNVVSIARNLICLRFAFQMPLKLLFMAVQIGLTLVVRPQGVVAWLPTLAACAYTWFLDTQNEKLLKTVMIACQFMWIFYDASIQNYSAMIFDIFTVFTNVIGIIRLKKERRPE